MYISEDAVKQKEKNKIKYTYIFLRVKKNNEIITTNE